MKLLSRIVANSPDPAPLRAIPIALCVAVEVAPILPAVSTSTKSPLAIVPLAVTFAIQEICTDTVCPAAVASVWVIPKVISVAAVGSLTPSATAEFTTTARFGLIAAAAIPVVKLSCIINNAKG